MHIFTPIAGPETHTQKQTPGECKARAFWEAPVRENVLTVTIKTHHNTYEHDTFYVSLAGVLLNSCWVLHGHPIAVHHSYAISNFLGVSGMTASQTNKNGIVRLLDLIFYNTCNSIKS